jgi:hypothetical protein
MNTQTITGTVKSLKRKPNSYNGNPNYSFDIEADNGVLIPVSTLNDYGINYAIYDGMDGKRLTVLLKVNRKSNKLLAITEG